MSILGAIFSKIFPSSHAANAPAAGPASAATPPAGGQGAPAQAIPAGAAPPASAPMSEVDVQAVLNDLADKNPQRLLWKASIVDLLKLLGLDSSLDSRKALAYELGYAGDTNDSAAMNVWLHRQVMNKLAANGGKVPADLRD